MDSGSSLFYGGSPVTKPWTSSSSAGAISFSAQRGSFHSPPMTLHSPSKSTPDRQQPSDRFIPDRGSQDHSMSRYYLTCKENATPSVLRSPEFHKKPSNSGGSPMTLSASEPYTELLAKTLFPAPQTTVLGLHEPNVPPMESEEQRYGKSLAVVYEENRTRNFTSRNFRVIAQTPERILDAPELLDDFYLNLVDWSSTNLLTVALGNTVYLWNADSGNITQLMSSCDRENAVSSVAWHPDGDLLAIGTHDAEIQIWSTSQKRLLQSVRTHSARVGSMAWNGCVLASGSRDATIALNDTREGRTFHTLTGHTQEVCGLRWNPNGQQLASGGNDNNVGIWDFRRISMECSPLFSLRDHTAAVKALSWNPVQSNLLVSGGGTADKSLRFWNTTTGECIHHIDAKSQTCGVLWSKTGKELVSSHGFADNQLTLWKYPNLRKITDLTGHTSRVLHLALSPCGQVVVSAAGDETIRFWRCFPPPASTSVAEEEDGGRLSGVGYRGGSQSSAASPVKRQSAVLDVSLRSPGPPQRLSAMLDGEFLR